MLARQPSRGRSNAVANETRRAGVRLRTDVVILIVFAAAFVVLGALAIERRSPTFDEPVHLAAGYGALVAGDYRVDPTHPPLARMWAALPLLVLPVSAFNPSPIDAAAGLDWLRQSVAYGRNFLYGPAATNPDRLVSAARLMVLVLGVLLGCLIYAWMRESAGLAPAVIALALYVFSPNLSAHATLVTTDLPLTCAFFAAVYAVWRALRPGAGTWSIAAVAAAAAVAIAVKFTGLVIIPVGAVLVGLAAWRGGPPAWRRAAWVTGATAVLVPLVIWAVYGFRYAPGPSDSWVFHFEKTALVTDHAAGLAPWLSWIDAHRLLPNAFTEGLLMSVASSYTQPMYLAGAYSTHGWWYYFPLAFLLKTPAAVVILAVAGIAAGFAGRTRLPRPDLAYVFVPILVVFGAAMVSGIDIGVRHVLPAYPFVILLAALGADALWRTRARTARVAVVALLALLGATFGRTYPHTLTFFTQFVGGSSRGIRYLADSNFDWGQGLKDLKHWMETAHVPQVNLAYFGTADPAAYGIDATLLPGTPEFKGVTIEKPRLPGYVALSANMLSGQYLSPAWRRYYGGFRNRVPDVDLRSIRVYWVDEWPEPVDDPATAPEAVLALARNLSRLHSYRHAARHFRRYLALRPHDIRALDDFGVMLAKSGDEASAVNILRRAWTLDPADRSVRNDFVVSLLGHGDGREALDVAEGLIAASPRDPQGHYLAGVVHAESGRLDDAASAFRRAVDCDPSFAAARDALARVESSR
jgi:hypothetical protein